MYWPITARVVDNNKDKLYAVCKKEAHRHDQFDDCRYNEMADHNQDMQKWLNHY